jgi:hypothetical protein
VGFGFFVGSNTIVMLRPSWRGAEVTGGDKKHVERLLGRA